MFKKSLSLFAAGAFFVSAFPVFSNVMFSDLDLNDSDILLFTENHDIAGSPSYKSLFKVQLGKNDVEGVPEILSCYPERMELLSGGKILQIRNRFGRARYDMTSGKLNWIEKTSTIPLDNIHSGAYSTSPDGKWICYVTKKNNASGELILENAETGEKNVLASKAAFEYEKVNVKWSYDSNTLLYEKNGNIYFVNPASVGKNIALAEEYRVIGQGNIECVNWTPQSIIYIDKDVVYKIPQNELYTRGLYSSLIESSNLISRLSEDFDMLHDRFWVNNLENEIVLVKNSKILSLYSFSNVSYGYADLKGIYSLTGLKGSPFDFNVYWNSDRQAVVWMDMLNYETGKKSATVYILKDKLEPVIEVKGVSSPKNSPDGRLLAFSSGSTIYVYDIKTWECKAKLAGEKVSDFLWVNSSAILAGGEETVSYWEYDPIKSGTVAKTPLFISSVEKAWWDGNRIVAEGSATKNIYAYDPLKNVWQESSVVCVGSNEVNARFRVFTGTAQNPLYSNSIYVRSLGKSVVNYSVFKESSVSTKSPKKIAIVFDAVDSAEGLSELLYVLEQWNIKATFFINGEFMKRYPLETKQILASGQECANGFYTKADLTSKNFRIDEDYIRRGLARNEDEFFAVTGKELSLLWHPPYYKSNEIMKSAGAKAGYEFIEAYTKINDEVTYEESILYGKEYLDASSIIDSYVSALKDGMIIPVRVGKTEGSRSDYLYEKLDLLISAILDSGCEIVNLRSVMGK